MLNTRSIKNLDGVHPDLVRVVTAADRIMRERHAAERLSFTVIEGRRTIERQRELFAAKASETMDSRHLTGHAVDMMVDVANFGRWDMELYYQQAECMRAAAVELDLPVRWGGCWETLNGMGAGADFMADAVTAYARAARGRGRRPFIDGPHFELARSAYP